MPPAMQVESFPDAQPRDVPMDSDTIPPSQPKSPLFVESSPTLTATQIEQGPVPLSEPEKLPDATPMTKTPPPTHHAPGSPVGSELSNQMECASLAASSGEKKIERDPNYYKVYRYFRPKKDGTLKCSEEAMKLWKAPGGSGLAVTLTLDCARFRYPAAQDVQRARILCGCGDRREKDSCSGTRR